MPLPQLPLEIWMKICEHFGHNLDRTDDDIEVLRALRLANRQTREAAETQFFRSLPRSHHYCKRDWPTYYQQVASNPSYARHVRHVKIAGRVSLHADWTRAQVSTVWEALKHLEGVESLEIDLNLREYPYYPVQLSKLCFNILKSKEIFPCLRSLYLDAVTDELLKTFLAAEPNALEHRFKRLRHLSIKSSPGDTFREQAQLLDLASSISSLHLQSVQSVWAYELRPGDTLISEFQHQNLRYIKLDRLRISGPGLCALIENSRNTLTTLCLRVIWLATGTWDNIFRALISTETLRSLELSWLGYCKTLWYYIWKHPWDHRPKIRMPWDSGHPMLGSSHWIDYYVLRDLYHHLLSHSGEVHGAPCNMQEFEKTLNLCSAENIGEDRLCRKAFRGFEMEGSFKVEYRPLFTDMYAARFATERKTISGFGDDAKQSYEYSSCGNPGRTLARGFGK